MTSSAHPHHPIPQLHSLSKRKSHELRFHGGHLRTRLRRIVWRELCAFLVGTIMAECLQEGRHSVCDAEGSRRWTEYLQVLCASTCLAVENKDWHQRCDRLASRHGMSRL